MIWLVGWLFEDLEKKSVEDWKSCVGKKSFGSIALLIGFVMMMNSNQEPDGRRYLCLFEPTVKPHLEYPQGPSMVLDSAFRGAILHLGSWGLCTNPASKTALAPNTPSRGPMSTPRGDDPADWHGVRSYPSPPCRDPPD